MPQGRRDYYRCVWHYNTENAIFDSAINDNVRIHGEIVIEDDNGDTMNVGATLKTISQRLCVLQAEFDAREQYPALKDAYNQYKMLEKLLAGTKDERKD